MRREKEQRIDTGRIEKGKKRRGHIRRKETVAKNKGALTRLLFALEDEISWCEGWIRSCSVTRT